MQRFCVDTNYSKINNLPELVEFLSNNQGKDIHLYVTPEAMDLEKIELFNIIDCFSFSKVLIETGNPFASHHKYKIHKTHWDNCIHVKDYAYTKYHSWDREKLFLAFYGRLTGGRVALASHLLHHHKSQSIIHFNADLSPPIDLRLNEVNWFEHGNLQEAARFLDNMPYLYSEKSPKCLNGEYNYDDDITDMYRHILIDIVAETHDHGHTFFPTEKIIRPMLLKKPFIVFANKNFLKYLQQIGFKTFSKFWPEIYDNYEDSARYEVIKDVIHRISQLSEDDLVLLYNNIQPILDHNYDLLINNKYIKSLSEI